MALTDYKITDTQMNQNGVISAPDTLTGTAAENKAVFDKLIRLVVQQAMNPVLDELAGSAGAASVGAAGIEGLSGENVQALLAALKSLRDADSSSQGATNTSIAEALGDRYTKAQTDAALALKFDAATAQGLVRSISFDPKTGIFTITYQDGTSTTIDTLLEKVAVNFALEGDTLVLTLEDGTTQEVDLSSFIDTYTFVDTDTVVFTAAGKSIQAQVKNGSITLGKLDPVVLESITAQADRAETARSEAQAARTASEAARDLAQTAANTAGGKASEAGSSAAEAAAGAAAADLSARAAAQSAALGGQSAQEADAKAVLAQSYAVGGTGTREGEDTDNARYYKEQAAVEKSSAQTERTAAEAANVAAQSARADAQTAKTASENARDTAQAAAGIAESKAAQANESAVAAAASAVEAAASAQGISAAEERAAASATAAAASAGTAKTEADRAKLEADRASEIVGGDFATKVEVSTAKQEAIDAAAADATTKANAAESAAKAASVPVTRKVAGKPLSADVVLTAADVGARADSWTPTTTEIGAIPAGQKGTANGVASLDAAGKVPAAQLPAMNYDPAGSAAAVQTALNTHTADTVQHVTAAERTGWNAKETTEGAQAKADAAEAAAKAASVPVSRKVAGKPLLVDVILTAADVGARADSWTPTAADVGAVPTGRTVNGKALSADVVLNATDVGAAAVQHTHTDLASKTYVDDSIAAIPIGASTCFKIYHETNPDLYARSQGGYGDSAFLILPIQYRNNTLLLLVVQKYSPDQEICFTARELVNTDRTYRSVLSKVVSGTPAIEQSGANLYFTGTGVMFVTIDFEP